MLVREACLIPVSALWSLKSFPDSLMGGMEVGRWNGDNAVGGGSAFSEHVRIHQRQRSTVQIGQNWAELSALIRAELGRAEQGRAESCQR